jgi:hypothetical protein
MFNTGNQIKNNQPSTQYSKTGNTSKMTDAEIEDLYRRVNEDLLVHVLGRKSPSSIKVHPKVKVIEPRVEKAFEELQKAGFVARSKFTCCSTCAIAELVEIAKDEAKDRGVFWHLQDDADFRATGELAIHYRYFPTEEDDNMDNQIAAKIGEQVADALQKQGLQIVWNVGPDQIIDVTG